MTEDGLDYLNNALNLIKPKIPNFTASNEFLKSIVTHLICNRVFMHVDTNIACNYINFWLNKKVKDLYYYEFDSNFKNFKEFVNKFYTVVKGDYKSYKSCTNSIQILGNEDYYQMNMLYSLFKEYDELKKINEWEYKVKNTCDIISKITNLANDVARKYKKDEEFIKVLKNLRETIKNAEGSYKTFCKSDLKQLDNMVTEREFPSIVHAPPTRQEILKPSDSLEQTTHQSLAHVSGNGIRNEPEPNVNLQARDSHEDRIEPSPFSVEQYEQSRDAHSSPEYTGYNSVSARFATGDVITSTQGAQSYLENIRGTITGVFQSVEPAPILGVSGGMGVLFLLFKEEEDVTILSPLASLGRTQVFQDMKNIMMEILDQVQLIYLIRLSRNNILFLQSITVYKELSHERSKNYYSKPCLNNSKITPLLNADFFKK
ncbi:hypothetical protein PVIIG_05734 [Plasmodium vivax India VII]|uniref:Uncharacterized protein n=1 Tax=Plasmodium vivax India VII TaxID=1077284 RepID=A0A0J9UU63_PLAVI|nr:hypothetical protein PVIIG_05734 [Plasmodium vivax India VII]